MCPRYTPRELWIGGGGGAAGSPPGGADAVREVLEGRAGDGDSPLELPVWWMLSCKLSCNVCNQRAFWPSSV